MTEDEILVLCDFSQALLRLYRTGCLMTSESMSQERKLTLANAREVIRAGTAVAEKALRKGRGGVTSKSTHPEDHTLPTPHPTYDEGPLVHDHKLALAILRVLNTELQLEPDTSDEHAITLAKYAAKRLLEDYDEK